MTNLLTVKSVSLEIKPKAMIFRGKYHTGTGREYVVLSEEMDYLDFIKKYPTAAKATPVGFDETWDNWYLVCVTDCFDPPVAIVRASNEQDAEEEFVDNLDWAHVKEPDLADYDEDSLSYGSKGQPYDCSQIRIERVWLVGIEL